MIKKMLLMVCIPTFVCAMDKPNPGLNLVTHCNGENATNFFPLKELWGHNPNFSSTRDVTTMDIKPHINKTAKHITGNVCTYPFKKNSINSVYMERPPTFITADDQSSYLGKAIKNLATGMNDGAMIEIELHPFSRITCSPEKALKEYDWPLFSNTENDPFTAQSDRNVFFMAFDIACNGIQIARQKSAQNNWFPPTTFINHAITLSNIIDKLLNFYENQNLGSKQQLKQHLNRECYILELFSKQPQIMFLHNGPSSGPEKFLSEVGLKNQALPLIPENTQRIKYLLSQETTKDGKRAYNEGLFLTESFANFILCDAFVILTHEDIKNFMRNNGFTWTFIEKKTSPYNGRKNVWIISALKGLSLEQVVILFMWQYAHGQHKKSA